MNESPTRQAGMGGSAVLERLASTVDTSGMPSQAHLLPELIRTQRMDRALDVPPKSEALSIALLLDTLPLLILIRAALEAKGRLNWEPIIWMMVVLIPMTIWAARRSSRRQVEIAQKRAAALAWSSQQPFPVTGYEAWLACDRPLLDVHLRAPVDRQLFERAVQAIDAAIEVEAAGDRAMRLAIPPVVRLGKHPMRHGNVALLHRVFAELVLPLHHDTGVERVELGGLVIER